MSLKAFHLVFITAAILLAFGFGVWLAKNFFSTGGAGESDFRPALVRRGHRIDCL